MFPVRDRLQRSQGRQVLSFYLSSLSSSLFPLISLLLWRVCPCLDSTWCPGRRVGSRTGPTAAVARGTSPHTVSRKPCYTNLRTNKMVLFIEYLITNVFSVALNTRHRNELINGTKINEKIYQLLCTKKWTKH